MYGTMRRQREYDRISSLLSLHNALAQLYVVLVPCAKQPLDGRVPALHLACRRVRIPTATRLSPSSNPDITITTRVSFPSSGSIGTASSTLALAPKAPKAPKAPSGGSIGSVGSLSESQHIARA